MKKFFIIIFILLLVRSGDTFAVEILKPSLINQMKYQEEVIKKNRILEQKQNNIRRLTEIRKSKSTTPSYIASLDRTPTITWSSYGTKTPIIQQTAAQIYQKNSTSIVPGVDMARVQKEWFGWYNNYRNSLGLTDYIYDARLDMTAHDWNRLFSESRWQNHHRRSPNDSYYDFSTIDAWFALRGVNPKIINRSKHTENVGYGYYGCRQSDCTDELISSIRSTFDFFMSEKGKSYDAHYRSIVNPYFTKMGFDIIIVPSENRYYITIHYVTAF